VNARAVIQSAVSRHRRALKLLTLNGKESPPGTFPPTDSLGKGRCTLYTSCLMPVA